MNPLEQAVIQCPYCGEALEIVIDCSIERQQYTEDCQVCCNPMEVTLEISGTGAPHIDVARENG